jgi:acyl-coenzyme A thioesterase PaaI-like protein
MSEDKNEDSTGVVSEEIRRLIRDRKPGQLMGRGHPAGDLLEAYDWKLLDSGPGRVRLRCQLPDHVRNPRGVLFGGFTATYVDLIAIFTCRAGEEANENRRWLNTLNMRVDYIEPIEADFIAESTVVNRRGPMYWIETRLLSEEGTMLAFAWTTLREVTG